MGKVFANVEKWALGSVRVSLLSFQKGVETVKVDIDECSKKYFTDFKRNQDILEERLKKAETKLRNAEDELYKQQQRVKIYYDQDGECHTIPADCSKQEKCVRYWQDYRDKCKRNVELCKKWIDECRDKSKAQLSELQKLHTDFSKAKDKLNVHADDVAEYDSVAMNSSQDIVTSSHPYADNHESQPSGADEGGKIDGILQLTGKVPPDSSIIIIDNTPFGGFGRLVLSSDSSGRLHGELKDTGDCTIYVNGMKVYDGPLSKY